MLQFLSDEDFNGDITRGVLKRAEVIDWVRAQDVGLSNKDDSVLLAWAAEHGRMVVSHDVNTLIGHAVRRIENGEKMPGVVIVSQQLPTKRAIEDLVYIAACGRHEDFENLVTFLPL